MDALLIISCIIIAVLMMVVNFYILVIYSHPDDRGWGVSLFCRGLVIFGLTLSWAQVLMLPLDVSNSKGTGGGLDMDNFWIAIYMMLAIMVIFLMPTAIYVYESDDEKPMVKIAIFFKNGVFLVFKALLCDFFGILHSCGCGVDFVHFVGFFEIRRNTCHYCLETVLAYGNVECCGYEYELGWTNCKIF